MRQGRPHLLGIQDIIELECQACHHSLVKGSIVKSMQWNDRVGRYSGRLFNVAAHFHDHTRSPVSL
jgi:hypothetical protein